MDTGLLMSVCSVSFGAFSIGVTVQVCLLCFALLSHAAGLRIKEAKEVYEGELVELTPEETENPYGGYGKTVCAFLALASQLPCSIALLLVGCSLSLTRLLCRLRYLIILE